MKYGIGITTRNRPHVLDTALRHFARFATADCKIVIVDDASEVSNQEVLESFIDTGSFGTVITRVAPERIGIAKAKNACLGALSDCEHVFLFDDDCWPISKGWAETWVDINRSNKIEHSMFNVGMSNLLDKNPAFRAVVKAKETVGHGRKSMVAYNNCFGVMLYFTRRVLDRVGGYAVNTPALYGYEHAQISKRIGQTGEFTRGQWYWTPWVATDLIYSVDISYQMLKLKPPIDIDWLEAFTSSVSPSEMSQAESNSIIMKDPEIFIPLEDPFGPLTSG